MADAAFPRPGPPTARHARLPTSAPPSLPRPPRRVRSENSAESARPHYCSTAIKLVGCAQRSKEKQRVEANEMPLILRGCQKCGGDLFEQAYIGTERENVCLQCGWRCPSRRPAVAVRRRTGVIDLPPDGASLARVG